MFKLCRKNERVSKPHARAEKAAAWLANGLLILQRNWARWMSEKEKQMTTGQKKKALGIFCFGLALVGGSLIYNAFFLHLPASSNFLRPPSVTLPNDTRLPDSLDLDYLRELHRQKQMEKTDSIQP